MKHRLASDVVLIPSRNKAKRGVDDQLNLPVLDQVGDVGPALADPQDTLGRNSVVIEETSRPLG